MSDFAQLELLTFIARKQLGIQATLNTIIEELAQMTDDASHLAADVQAENDALTAIEAEIANLKSQPAAAPLDFTGLDAVVARLKGDAPAAPASDPNAPAAPADSAPTDTPPAA